MNLRAERAVQAAMMKSLGNDNVLDDDEFEALTPAKQKDYRCTSVGYVPKQVDKLKLGPCNGKDRHLYL